MRCLIAVLLAGFALPASGQVRVVATERLPLPVDHVWSAPQFSPDGTRIFVTTAGYRGVWRFTPATRSLEQICDDAGAGYGFTVSPDGNRIAYRRTLEGTSMNRRVQEVVEVDLSSGEQTVMASGRDLPTPIYAGDRVLFDPSGTQKSMVPAMVQGNAVLGIEETKIAAVVDGKPARLDPYRNGSYIWASLSPDRTRMVAYEMARGMFVSDLAGNVLAEFGRCDAPSWMRNGRWVVYMREKNDGQQITGSDIYCVAPDGGSPIRLTATPAIELMPVCSPVDDRILVCTPSGEILVLTYREEGR
jgi:Tol biopolymer transport system component